MKASQVSLSLSPPPGKASSSTRWLAGALVFCILYKISCWFRPSFDLFEILLSVPDAEHVRQWSAYYTSESHLAGQGLHQGQWTAALWKEFGVLDTQISSYWTKLPAAASVEGTLALSKNGKVIYEASLFDDQSRDRSANFIPAHLGFTASGNLSASYVFCNFGSVEDFNDLAMANVSLKGKIGIMKLGNASPYLEARGLNIFRGTQISNAAKNGLVAIAMYVDPQNDGPIVEANGYKPFPAGPARSLEAIERGGMGNFEYVRKGELPNLPCLPMAAADAVHILRALHGHGPSAAELGERWQGGGLDYYGVQYHTGPSPDNLSLHVRSHANIEDRQIHDVVGLIPGKISDEVVLVGNHRDAWGPGAGDPNSGSAALNEVVRAFGEAVRRGWRPLRTIVFISFEGEEFAQIGSLLYINDKLEWLRKTAVAYLNVVVAGSGSRFKAKASPLLYPVVLGASGHVDSPNQTVRGQSVRDVWGESFSPAGSGDANRFQGIPCVPTVDISFATAEQDPVFHYHTGFDNFEWMEKLGDPGWKHHVASAKIMALMTAQLTEAPVLAMNASSYPQALNVYVARAREIEHVTGRETTTFDLGPLDKALARMSEAAKRFDAHAESLRTSLSKPWYTYLIKRAPKAAIRQANQVYMAIERQFYYSLGLDFDSMYHHVIYGPSAWHDEGIPMPGLMTSLRAGNLTNAIRWRDVIVERIDSITDLLEQHLDNGS